LRSRAARLQRATFCRATFRFEDLPMIAFAPLTPDRAPAVEALLDRAFEPGRHGRTAYKVRGAATPIAALSFVAVEGDALLGSIQCWPVALLLDRGGSVPLVMVGPVAVAPECQRTGLGRQLMDTALAAAAEAGLDDAMMLIGDPEYYGRFFGFTADRTAGWRVPGPVEARRLLARGTAVPAAAGMLGPRVAVDA
jgi:predicted N-acetyltransferase YhbS